MNNLVVLILSRDVMLPKEFISNLLSLKMFCRSNFDLDGVISENSEIELL